MSYQTLASALKVLADPSRLEILDILSCGERCACDLLEHFNFSQPTLSHHMKVLVDYKLVTTRKEGNKRLYQLNHENLQQLTQQLTTIHTSTKDCVCHEMKSGVCS